MKLWRVLGRRARRLRELIQPAGSHGTIEVEDVVSAAALVRAIDEAMPYGSELWVDFPGDEAVELFLAERTGRSLSRSSRSSYLLPITGDNLDMLARLVEGQPAQQLGVHLGVDLDGRRLLAAYDLDSGSIGVSLARELAPDAVRRFTLIATDGAPGPD